MSHVSPPQYGNLEDTVGNTPLVRLQRLPGVGSGVVLAKLEGNNPAGSVKDRPAFSMIAAAEDAGLLNADSELIEATSGNTGIALAAAAAVRGYRITLVMPAGASRERLLTMQAYGAKVVETDKERGIEYARDVAEEIAATTGAIRLDQFANPGNPAAHAAATGPEIWEQTKGTVTHFVSAMGTTGTITGTSRFLKSKSADVQIVGVQPAPGSQIPGIRAWSPEYVPAIFDRSAVDDIREVTRDRAVETARQLARAEGLLAGMSTGGAAAIALDIAAENPDATVVFVACDRGDRYLTTDLFG